MKVTAGAKGGRSFTASFFENFVCFVVQCLVRTLFL